MAITKPNDDQVAIFGKVLCSKVGCISCITEYQRLHCSLEILRKSALADKALVPLMTSADGTEAMSGAGTR